MTEQMAIEETIKEAEESAEINRLEALEYRKHGDINARHIEELSMKLAEQYGNVAMWLKELIQYRAIGTPTQILEKIGGLDVELGKYACIGTVEELQALKEKSVAKKPRWYGHHFCPHCDSIVYVNGGKDVYCPKCGQHLDWE